MRHTHSLALSTLGLALILAACGQGAPQVGSAADSAASSAASSADTASAPATPDAAVPNSYLVGFRLAGEGTASFGTQRLGAQALQAQALTVQAVGGAVKEQYADIGALSASLTAEQAAALRAGGSVEYVEPDYLRHALGFRSGSTDAGAGAGLNAQALTPQAAVRWTPSGETTWGDSALRVPTLRGAGYTGSGSAVCVGDTGIDGNHPEFGKLLKGFRNFTGEANRSSAYSTNDVSHHGTHVSGTVFAQYGSGTGAPGLQSGEDPNGVGGVASGINLYMARVLDDTGSGSSSNIISGVNWCVSQLKSQGGAESRVVVSLSLGGGSSSQTEQRAYTAAYNKGALIVAASGNDGAAIGYPAAYTNVLAVGAIDNTGTVASFSNTGSKLSLVGPGVGVLSSVPLGTGERASASASGVAAYGSVMAASLSGQGTVNASIVAAGGSNNEFCGSGTTSAALKGNIALIARGTCSFEEKVTNAVNSGAAAVIVYNNAAGPLGMSLSSQKNIPVVGIPQADGQATLAQLPTSGTVSVGSADYEYFDGTSMATPHVSAAAAVVWAAKPALSNTQLTTLLQNTATDLGASGKDSTYGYGLVNPYKAITGN